jgi:hypothetical protein
MASAPMPRNQAQRTGRAAGSEAAGEPGQRRAQRDALIPLEVYSAAKLGNAASRP